MRARIKFILTAPCVTRFGGIKRVPESHGRTVYARGICSGFRKNMKR